MMKTWTRRLLPLLLCAGASLAALDRIAVAEIETKGKLDAASVAGLAERIEAKLGGGYEVISRSALKAMLKEAAFQQESGLVADREQLARLAEVHGVKYLLATTIARIGSKLSMTVMVVDCTTGRLDPDRRIAIEADNLEKLFRQLDGALDRIGLLHLPPTAAGLKQLAVLPVQAAPGIGREDGSAFGAKLNEFLLKSGSFELLNRDALNLVAMESALVDAEQAAPGQYVKVGQIAVGDWLIAVKLKRLEVNRLSSGTAIAGVSTREVATLEAELRIIDVKTGALVAIENVTCRRKTTDIPANVRRDWTAADYRNDLMEQAAEQAGRKLLERLDPVLVAAIEGKQLYLTRGEGAGVRPGQTYEIYTPGKTVLHPKTKKPLGTAEKRVGVARIDSVAANMSIASLQDGAAEAAVGARCRLLADAPAVSEPASPPAYPMATP